MSLLSERLKELRGLTSQSEMARQLGMPRPQWIRYETGKNVPGSDILEKICRYHACSADWLLGLKDRGGSINAGAGAAIAVGANARATSRTTNYQPPTTNTPGAMPACSKCPHLKKLKKLEALLSK